MGRCSHLLVPPGPIDPDRITSGGVATGRVRLRNVISRAITDASLTTICLCLRPGRVPLTTGPGDEADLDLTFDSSAEPEFVGDLAISARGRDEGGSPVFGATVGVRVVARPDHARADPAP